MKTRVLDLLALAWLYFWFVVLAVENAVVTLGCSLLRFARGTYPDAKDRLAGIVGLGGNTRP